MFFHFITKHTCDRQTDRQNYDPQDCASVAASRGKNRPKKTKIIVRNSGTFCVSQCGYTTDGRMLVEMMLQTSIKQLTLTYSRCQTVWYEDQQRSVGGTVSSGLINGNLMLTSFCRLSSSSSSSSAAAASSSTCDRQSVSAVNSC